MKFLFTTIQFEESDFYARVSRRLRDDHGHEVVHVVISRRAARAMARDGLDARCLPDLMAGLPAFSLPEEIARVEAAYDIPSLRDLYLADPACSGRDEAWCVERAVRHVLALESVFDDLAPDVLIPEVGSETMRTAAQLISAQRDSDSILLFYTIFPRPLRLFVNTVNAPIVDAEEVRPLDDAERREVEDFIAAYVARGRPTVPYRRAVVTPGKLRDFARHVAVAAAFERDNEYLRPSRFVTGLVRQRARAAASRRLYEPPDGAERPFAYFPLHVTDDFKVKKVIPHCADQAYLIRLVADALPQGVDLVLKEHPVSIGRNPVTMLRDLVRRPNVRLVAPHTSSHELIRRSRAVIVISSTVGLEALLHGKAVLTMGRPFYSGYGVTLDVESFADVRRAVPEVLRFQPDRERTLRFLHAAMRSTYPGAPAGVSGSDENAAAVAASLHEAALAQRAVAVSDPD